MSSTTEQLTEAERVAIHHAANYCTADGHYETAEELRKLLARLRPKPSLPERVYVGLGAPAALYLMSPHSTGFTEAEVSRLPRYDTPYTILPEFPGGLDTLESLAHKGIGIVYTTHGRWRYTYLGEELGPHFDRATDALRVALTYANRKADQ